jgi:hypothetical protein
MFDGGARAELLARLKRFAADFRKIAPPRRAEGADLLGRRCSMM